MQGVPVPKYGQARAWPRNRIVKVSRVLVGMIVIGKAEEISVIDKLLGQCRGIKKGLICISTD